MKVILKDDVMGLGEIGETVAVRPGFARNYLIPRGMALEVSSASSRELEHQARQIESKKRRLKSSAEKEAQRLRDTVIEMGLKVATSGKVFGSVGTKDIAERLGEAGFAVDRRRVLLPEPIRKIGTHFVRVKFHAEVEASLKVNVVAIEASQEDEEKAASKLKAHLEEKLGSEAGED